MTHILKALERCPYEMFQSFTVVILSQIRAQAFFFFFSGNTGEQNPVHLPHHHPMVLKKLFAEEFFRAAAFLSCLEVWGSMVGDFRLAVFFLPAAAAVTTVAALIAFPISVPLSLVLNLNVASFPSQRHLCEHYSSGWCFIIMQHSFNDRSSSRKEFLQ
jgi:membrane-bound acyltransferase YfiQ involved in biofilm formation